MELNKNPINLNKINDRTQIPSPLREDISQRIRAIDDLKYFLITAPIKWMANQVLRKYYLNDQLGYISCIYWDNLYYITGTDITKILIFRLEKFGRKIINKKKFEEGIFSDLRSLKVDEDCILQSPKSEMLQFLNKNGCIKTQKKQKVFFWFSVLHDRLFADCLERDCKREFELDMLLRSAANDKNNEAIMKKIDNIKQSITSEAVFEPAISFKYKYQSMTNESLSGKSPSSRFNRTKSKSDDINNANKNKLYEQLSQYMKALDMVKTPSANSIKFNFENEHTILKTETPSFNISPTVNHHNIEPPNVSINHSKINTEKTLGLAKKRKQLGLTIDVPYNNNTIVNNNQVANNYSQVEVEYNDQVNPHIQNHRPELPLADTYKDEMQNVAQKRKLNTFVPNYSNSASVEYKKYMEQLVSPMGGYMNPFQLQHSNSHSAGINDKFLFNGTGFTPMRSAFPDAMPGNPYMQPQYATTELNKPNQEGNPGYVNLFSGMPLFTSTMPNVQWGFMNNNEGGYTGLPPLSSVNGGMKTFSSNIGKEESLKKEEKE